MLERDGLDPLQAAFADVFARPADQRLLGVVEDVTIGVAVDRGVGQAAQKRDRLPRTRTEERVVARHDGRVNPLAPEVLQNRP